MKQWVVWLRGINVGGHRIITMEELTQLFASMGLEQVQTTIQSGNVTFASALQDAGKLKAKIEKRLSETFGSETMVAVCARAELDALVQRDPFARFKVPPKAKRYVTFLTEPARFQPTFPLVTPNQDLHLLALEGMQVFSLGLPDKHGRFGFPNTLVERECGTWGTTRNWNTVIKVFQ